MSAGYCGVITETAGDITTQSNSVTSHWGGGASTFDSEQIIDRSSHSLPRVPASTDDTSSSSSESLLGKLDQDMNTHGFGQTYVSGLWRSLRTLYNQSQEDIQLMMEERIDQTIEESDMVFDILACAADMEDIEVTTYLPEPKNIFQLLQCPLQIKIDRIKSMKRELKFIIDNDTFRRGVAPHDDDEIIPSMFIFKAKRKS